MYVMNMVRDNSPLRFSHIPTKFLNHVMQEIVFIEHDLGKDVKFIFFLFQSIPSEIFPTISSVCITFWL